MLQNNPSPHNPMTSYAGAWRQQHVPVQPKGRSGPLNALTSIGTRITVSRGQEIYTEGDAATACYQLISGNIRTVKVMSDGRRHVYEFLAAGDLLGLEIQDEHYLTAEAVTDVVLLRYPRSTVEQLMNDDASLAKEVQHITAQGLHAAYQRMALLSHKSAQERMAWFLLHMADRALVKDAAHVHLTMTRTDIADYLGMVIETVSRVLSQLKRNGAIAIQSISTIELLDRPFLEEIRGEI